MKALLNCPHRKMGVLFFDHATPILRRGLLTRSFTQSTLLVFVIFLVFIPVPIIVVFTVLVFVLGVAVGLIVE